MTDFFDILKIMSGPSTPLQMLDCAVNNMSVPIHDVWKDVKSGKDLIDKFDKKTIEAILSLWKYQHGEQKSELEVENKIPMTRSRSRTFRENKVSDTAIAMSLSGDKEDDVLISPRSRRIKRRRLLSIDDDEDDVDTEVKEEKDGVEWLNEPLESSISYKDGRQFYNYALFEVTDSSLPRKFLVGLGSYVHVAMKKTESWSKVRTLLWVTVCHPKATLSCLSCDKK